MPFKAPALFAAGLVFAGAILASCTLWPMNRESYEYYSTRRDCHFSYNTNVEFLNDYFTMRVYGTGAQSLPAQDVNWSDDRTWIPDAFLEHEEDFYSSVGGLSGGSITMGTKGYAVALLNRYGTAQITHYAVVELYEVPEFESYSVSVTEWLPLPSGDVDLLAQEARIQ